MMSVATKYECKDCGSLIKNDPINIKKHCLTKKHLAGKNYLSTDPKAVQQRERMKLYRQRKKEQIGEKNYRELATFKKKTYRERQKQKPIESKTPPNDNDQLLWNIGEGNDFLDSVTRTLDMEDSHSKKEFCDEIYDHLATQVKENPKLKVRDIKNTIKDKVVAQKILINKEESISQLIERMDKTNLTNKNLTINSDTLKKYFKNISNLHRKIYNENWSLTNWDWLSDSNKIIEFIKNNYKTDATRLSYVKSIVSILQRLDGFGNILKPYKKEQDRLKTNQDQFQGENKLSVNQKKNWIDWPLLAKKQNFGTDESDFLHSLYTCIPPRRLEYRLLKYYKMKKKNKKNLNQLDPKFNWFVCDYNNNPKTLVFNDYKTVKKYGQTQFDISGKSMPPIFKFEELRKRAKAFILSSGIESNELCFPTSKGNVYSSSSFTRRIQDYCFNETGKNVSVNILRHSFISYYNNKKNIKYNTLKLLASWMAHSVQESVIYKKFIEEDNSELIQAIDEASQ